MPPSLYFSLFERLKQGNREVMLGHSDLTVECREGYALDDLPDGTWAWVGPRDEACLKDGATIEDHPGVARTSTGRSHIFAGDGTISALTIQDGRLAFRRRIVDTARRQHEEEERGKPRSTWLKRQERSRKEGLTPITRAGMRESANVGIYPFGGYFVTTHEGARPYRVDPYALETLGPVGAHRAWDPTSPWFRWPGLGALLAPFGGPMTPLTSTTSHPGRTRDALYFSHLWYRRASLQPEQVKDGRRTQDADLHVVVWRPLDAQEEPLKRLDVRHRRTGRRARIGWGTHQCCVTDRWFIVLDSGFVAESYKWDAGARGAPCQDTVLWFVDREQLDDSKAGAVVDAFRVALPGRPTVHAYADFDDDGGKRVRLWLQGNRFFDSSEWVRGDDRLRVTGEPAPQAVWGLPSSDQAPAGTHPKGWSSELYELDIFPAGEKILGDRTIFVPRGVIFAADPEPEVEKIADLWWVSQGTWPELDTVEQAETWGLDADEAPARAPTALFRLQRRGHEPDSVFTFPKPTWVQGAAQASTPDHDFLMLAATVADSVDESHDELVIFDTRNPQSPAFVIRPKRAGGLALGVGLHGIWMAVDACVSPEFSTTVASMSDAEIPIPPEAEAS